MLTIRPALYRSTSGFVFAVFVGSTLNCFRAIDGREFTIAWRRDGRSRNLCVSRPVESIHGSAAPSRGEPAFSRCIRMGRCAW